MALNKFNLVSLVSKYYHQMITRRPFTTQSIQTGVLMTLSDVIAQTLVEKKTIGDNYDIRRTLTFTALGSAYVGPALSVWYRILDKLVKPVVEQPKIIRGMKKVFIDQLCFAPTFIGSFLIVLNAAKGKNVEEIKTELNDKYINIVKANYKFWPLAQFLNFSLVPPTYTILANQTAAVFWNVYLSWASTQEIVKEEK